VLEENIELPVLERLQLKRAIPLRQLELELESERLRGVGGGNRRPCNAGAGGTDQA
jgi:hypothetical protein